jgi:two-component system cell cycle response regulator
MSSTEVRLLLVDDDPSAIQAMSRMLAQYPDQRFATSGAAALQLAREAAPDLIVMDVDMPGMSGFDVCDALKADPALAHVPIIFATSHDTTTLLQATALNRGAAALVSKPLNAARLVASVSAQLPPSSRDRAAPAEQPAANAAARPPGRRTPRVLIVDDDTASIDVLRHTLAAIGDLHFAKSGEEAMRIARRLVPDLILLDAHMPGLDGFDVCRSLKAEPEFQHVPIAFATRYADPCCETRALDLGAADFIAKPYTPAVLQARVRNLLDLSRCRGSEKARSA